MKPLPPDAHPMDLLARWPSSETLTTNDIIELTGKSQCVVYRWMMRFAERHIPAPASDVAIKALAEIRRLTDEQNGPSRSSLLSKIAAVADAALAVQSGDKG